MKPHVITPYYSNAMDELAKDLSHALDESSDIRIFDGKVRRSKTWKCRSKSKSGMICSSNVLKYSAKSEDSESSLDTAFQGMDFSKRGYHHHTDSDDIIYKINQHNYHLNSWRPCSINLGESDSVNENFYPLREPRRKKKFKRMTVDPPSVTEEKFQILSNVSLCTQKSKRLRNIKPQKISKLTLKSPKLSKLTVSQLSAEMENICKDFGNANASTGKRKRCAYEKSIECNGCDCKDFVSTRSGLSNSCHHSESDDVSTKTYEFNSSGLSSSESECGVLTNDESREADDEQSDFFQESGPTYGIPNFSPWWQDDTIIPEEKILHPDLQDILSESFHHISETSKNMYDMQVNNYKAERQIRSGRRRLEKGLTPRLYQKMISPDDLLSCMPVTNEFDCFSLSVDNCFSKITPNEKKKRRGMPPINNSIHDFGDITTCIQRRQSLVKKANEITHSSPPPPPSSPQLFLIKKESCAEHRNPSSVINSATCYLDANTI